MKFQVKPRYNIVTIKSHILFILIIYGVEIFNCPLKTRNLFEALQETELIPDARSSY